MIIEDLQKKKLKDCKNGLEENYFLLTLLEKKILNRGAKEQEKSRLAINPFQKKKPHPTPQYCLKTAVYLLTSWNKQNTKYMKQIKPPLSKMKKKKKESKYPSL